MSIQTFNVVKSTWPNLEGNDYWTISDGVDEKGEFESKEEAEDNMARIMYSWRCDS
ncbi:hypothetical protein NST07_20385 [Paenibacillus sp. FSL L8-0340]|uniref:hypothetical protein n=1 Tax=Paenibacillus sp. FSL L8-0340 TaxID=2954685 RepID=UPI00315877E8